MAGSSTRPRFFHADDTLSSPHVHASHKPCIVPGMRTIIGRGSFGWPG